MTSVTAPTDIASLGLHEGREGYRMRVESYRIIYTIHDDVLVVVIVTIGHRSDVYGQRNDDDA